MTIYPSISIIIIVFYLTITKAEEYVFGDEEFERERVSKVERIIYKIRCTRRFNPGNCVDSVVPVWTFVFQNQNCSERLGCQLALRSNRFPNYRTCMRHCQPLADLYLQMLTYNKQSIVDSPDFRKMLQGEAAVSEKEDDVRPSSLAGYDNEQNKEVSRDIVEIEAFYKDGNKYDEEFKEEPSVFPPNIDYVDNEAESDIKELSIEE